ncbi:MAG: methyltransferase domain-containing protein [Clostridiaceae bacterium]
MDSEYGRFANVYDALMRSVDYDGWADYLVSLLSEHGVRPGDSVVDCACGTGELTIRLSKRGFLMTGVDRSEEMLAVAQKKARLAGQKIPFVCQDMRELSLHKPASAIVCACDGVNYLLTQKDVNAFFGSAHQALKPGGALLFDISSAYKLECVLGAETYGEDTSECAYLWQNAFDPESRLIEMNLSFFVPDGSGKYERFTEQHIQRAHTVEDLLAALRQSGFASADAYEAFTKNDPGAASERIQFAARRAEKGE